MNWITTKTVTTTKTIVELHGPLKILVEYIMPGIALLLVALIIVDPLGIMPRTRPRA